jgi:hypothetical protein
VLRICDRGNALLKAGWRYVRRVTCCPKRVTQIAPAALVLTALAHSWRERLTMITLRDGSSTYSSNSRERGLA